MRTDDRLSAIEERLDNLEAQRRCLSMRQDQLEGRVGAHRADLTDLRNILGAYRAEVSHVQSEQQRHQNEHWYGQASRPQPVGPPAFSRGYRARMRGLMVVNLVLEQPFTLLEALNQFHAMQTIKPAWDDNFVIVPAWLFDAYESSVGTKRYGSSPLLSRANLDHIEYRGTWTFVKDGGPSAKFLDGSY